MVVINRAFFLLAALCLAAVLPGYAQNRYMVFFKDKAGTPFVRTDSLKFLSQKAIDRRITQDIALEERDLPVTPAYVQAIRDLGVATFFTTRWMNGVLVQCPASQVAGIEALAFVDRVDLVAPGTRLNEFGRKRSNTARQKKNRAGESTALQNSMIGLDYMHEQGYRGEGMTIAVLDSGFPGVNTAAPFQDVVADNRIDLAASYDFVYNTSQVFQYDRHGTEVFSILAAYVPGSYVGGAHKASFQLYVTEDADSEYRIEEYNWLFAAERADSAGADIISSSLGYYDFDDASMNYAKADMNGSTTVISRAARWVAARGMVMVCSAGNEGTLAWKIITAPADAPGILAVGNVTSEGQRAFSSSVGPSADNRIKPDVSALGQSVSVIVESGNTSAESGTSVSAPLVTSLVAGVWQRYPQLTGPQVIDLIRNTASQAQTPDNEIGYGIPNFKAVVNYQETVDQPQPFVVYPNPVLDTLHVRPSDTGQIPTCQLELVSAQGRLLASQSVAFDLVNRVYETDLAALPAGLYFLNVTAGEQRYTFRIIKR